MLLLASRVAPDPAQHYAAVVGIVVGIVAIIGAIWKAAHWLDERNETTTVASVRKVLLGGENADGTLMPGVLIPAVERAVEPIREEQRQVYNDLRAHMEAEAEVLAAQADSYARHIADDLTFQGKITERMDRDAEQSHQDRALMLGLLRDALHSDVDPHPGSHE